MANYDDMTDAEIEELIDDILAQDGGDVDVSGEGLEDAADSLSDAANDLNDAGETWKDVVNSLSQTVSREFELLKEERKQQTEELKAAAAERAAKAKAERELEKKRNKRKRGASKLVNELGLDPLGLGGFAGGGALGGAAAAVNTIKKVAEGIVKLTRAHAEYDAQLNKTYSAFGGLSSLGNGQLAFDSFTNAFNKFKASILDSDAVISVLNSLADTLNSWCTTIAKGAAIGLDAGQALINGQEKVNKYYSREENFMNAVDEGGLDFAIKEFTEIYGKEAAQEMADMLPTFRKNRISPRMGGELIAYSDSDALGERAAAHAQEMIAHGWMESAANEGWTSIQKQFWSQGVNVIDSEDITTAITEGLEPWMKTRSKSEDEQRLALTEIADLLASGNGTTNTLGLMLNDDIRRAYISQYSGGQYGPQDLEYLSKSYEAQFNSWLLLTEIQILNSTVEDGFTSLNNWKAETQQNGEYLEQIKNGLYSFDEVINQQKRKIFDNGSGTSGGNAFSASGSTNDKFVDSMTAFLENWGSGNKKQILLDIGYQDSEAEEILKTISDTVPKEKQKEVLWAIYVRGTNGRLMTLDEINSAIDKLNQNVTSSIAFDLDGLPDLDKAVSDYAYLVGLDEVTIKTVLDSPDQTAVDNALNEIVAKIEKMNDEELLELLIGAGYSEDDAGQLLEWIKEVSGKNKKLQAKMVFGFYAKAVTGKQVSMQEAKTIIDNVKSGAKPEIEFGFSDFATLQSADKIVTHFEQATGMEINFSLSGNAQDALNAIHNAYIEFDAMSDYDKTKGKGNDGVTYKPSVSQETMDKLKGAQELFQSTAKLGKSKAAEDVFMQTVAKIFADEGIDVSGYSTVEEFQQLIKNASVTPSLTDDNGTVGMSLTEDLTKKMNKWVEWNDIPTSDRRNGYGEALALYEKDFKNAAYKFLEDNGFGDYASIYKAWSADALYMEILKLALDKNYVPAQFQGKGPKTKSNSTHKSTSTGKMEMAASGGIITGPTKALVGEGGRTEAVIPLETQGGVEYLANAMKIAGLGGNSAQTTVHVNLNGQILEMNDYNTRRLGERLAAIIDNERNRRGGLNYEQ